MERVSTYTAASRVCIEATRLPTKHVQLEGYSKIQLNTIVESLQPYTFVVTYGAFAIASWQTLQLGTKRRYAKL